MLEFCPSSDSYEVAWVNNGFSRCFLDTASSVVSSTFLLVAGFSELVLCKPKAAKIEKQSKRPWTPWMIIVIALCLLQVWCIVLLAWRMRKAPKHQSIIQAGRPCAMQWPTERAPLSTKHEHCLVATVASSYVLLTVV